MNPTETLCALKKRRATRRAKLGTANKSTYRGHPKNRPNGPKYVRLSLQWFTSQRMTAKKKEGREGESARVYQDRRNQIDLH